MTDTTTVVLPEPLRAVVTDLDRCETVEDLAMAHAAVQAVADVVDERRKDVRARLDEAALDDARGQGVTRRVDGVGQVIVTRPKATARVVDHEAFAGWYRDRWPAAVQTRRRVEVTDHEALAGLLDGIDDEEQHADDVLVAIERCLSVSSETFLPDGALDLALEGGSAVITPAGDLIDTDTGEHVPGTQVRPAGAQRVQVKPDTKARKAAAALARRALTHPHEELTRG